MKTIGILGGMSWESTLLYYKEINQRINHALGGSHSGKILIHSVDFYEIETLMGENRWDEMGKLLANAAKGLEDIGAEFIVIASNTSHKVYEQIKNAVSAEVLHIGDATAEALLKKGIKKAGLTGTRYTMTENYIKEKLERQELKFWCLPKIL